MPIQFPQNPSTGQTYTSGPYSWQYDGERWRTFGGGATGATGPTGPGTNLAVEAFTKLTNSTGVVTHNYNIGRTWVHESILGNFTANFTNVPTTDNFVILYSLVLVQGATAYLPTAVQINSVGQIIKWNSSIVPTGTANSVEVVNFNLFRISSAWTVIASLTSFSSSTVTTSTSTSTSTTTAAPTSTSTSTSTTTAGPQSFTVSYDVIAGGGSGGLGGYPLSTSRIGAGGGAGGFLSGSATKVTGTAYNISIGGGGAYSTSSTGTDNSGTNSYFDSHTATGGGYGGRMTAGAGSGGSGGGGSEGVAGSGVGGQGYAGRRWPESGYNSSVAAGGGGGAGGQPPSEYPTSPWNASSGAPACIDGGPGRTSTITGGTYGGGGAGGYYNGTIRRPGGSGGGGNGGVGASSSPYRTGEPGGTNTGGGGGGGSYGSASPSPAWAYGGNGGSGVIFLKIPDSYQASFSVGLNTSGGSASGGFRVYTISSGIGTVTFN